MLDKYASVTFVHNDGSFAFLGVTKNLSRYCGLHHPLKTSDGWTMVKTIHSVLPTSPIVSIKRDSIKGVLTTANGAVTYYYLPKQVLLIESDKSIEFEAIFDVREIYDFSTDGRFYRVDFVDGIYYVTYTKKENGDVNSQTQSLHGAVYEFVIGVSSSGVAQQNNWVAESFVLDSDRHSTPSEQYLYHWATITSSQIILATGATIDEVKEKILNTKSHRNLLLETKLQHAQLVEKNAITLPQEYAQPFSLATKSFDELVVTINGTTGIYAGIPWFYQFWTRDEAISVGALFIGDRFNEAVGILLRYTKGILNDGRTQNRFPPANLGCADGLGWVCKRWLDLMAITGNKLTEYVSREQLIDVYELVHASAEHLANTYMRSGLIENTALETWMDTSHNGDDRAGFRIEIQALYLVQLRFLNKLHEFLHKKPNVELLNIESEFRGVVVRRLFSEYLCDGLHADLTLDTTIRPNVFLAYYLYPWLLSNQQWSVTFDKAIGSLYLDWGGFSSIDKKSQLFNAYYTGQNNISYHRGDSWFFINHIAAMSLVMLDGKKYGEIVRSILDASTHELMSMGSVGTIAEVSDANQLSSRGCLSQAWSLATYIELLTCLSGKEFFK